MPSDDFPSLPAGPCVGGPWDRKAYISNARHPYYFMVAEMALPPPDAPFCDVATSPVNKVHCYHLSELHFQGDARIHFWRHEELSPFEAVSRVFESYVRGNHEETEARKREALLKSQKFAG